jgi:hypothetical protein
VTRVEWWEGSFNTMVWFPCFLWFMMLQS